MCASVITEADFFGFDALLNHVKVEAYYNSRDPKEDYPAEENIPRLDEELFTDWMQRRNAARRKHRQSCTQIDDLFEQKDESHALTRFDEVYGDIGSALRSGVLPAYFLKRKPPKPEPFKKVVQVMPTDATSWLLLGMVEDTKYGFRHDFTPMHSMEMTVTQPARVRRVVCQALVENERGHRWLEPMVALSATDLEDLMNDGSHPNIDCLYYGVNIKRDTSLTDVTGGLAQRTLLASDWLEAMEPLISHIAPGPRWTHLLVAETPPREFGFSPHEA